MRVISGSARGAKLKTLEGNDTRPTTDKVKGAIFNILSNYVYGKNVLDLFAGSGALGIEALSRGAKSAVFVEKSAAAAEIVNKNLEHTKLGEKARIIRGDVLSSLKTINGKFDLIFLDPPYAMNLVESAISEIERNEILSENGIIVAESDAEKTPAERIGTFEMYDSRKYGRININFYKKSEINY